MIAKDTAISVAELSKCYRIGVEAEAHESVSHALFDFIKSPLSNFYKYRGLYDFRDVLSGAATQPDSEFADVLWALRDVSFEVKRGEVLGIIGKNGAGKSTLLKVLARITTPTQGRVQVRGRMGSLLEVGTGFHPDLTGRENVYLNGTILGMRKREVDRKFEQIVDFSGVRKFLDTPVKRYSSGMRVRLAFAVAAHLEPDLLIVDEVLAVGDAEFQKKCLQVMENIQSSGRTVVFVSHNMAAIENLCTRTLWIDNGRIREDGDTREVIKAYLSSYSQVQAQGYDLREVQPRHGSGDGRFTAMAFLDPGGREKDVIRSGDAMMVRLYYHVERRIEHPHFGFKIYSELGTLITEMNTWATGVEIPYLTPGDGHIDLEIDFLNLMPDRYHVSLWMEGVGPVWYDVLEQCAIFDIEISNYYETSRGIDSRFGLIFLPCRWKNNKFGKEPSESLDAVGANR